MGGLFGKIFLSFWVAALLFGGALWTVEHYTGEDGIAKAMERLDEEARDVEVLLATDGLEGLAPWLEAEFPRLWLFSTDGQLLLGERPRGPLRDLLTQGIPTEPIELPRGGLLLSQRLKGGEWLVTITRVPHMHLLPIQRLALAIAVSGLFSLILALLLTRPIRRLRHAAQRLAEGDLEVRVGYKGHDEVAALASDFDLMAERIRALLQSQRQLLSDLSHELRSPLSRLKVALELARHNGNCDQALVRIERESERLEGLVTNVLSLARLESGQVALARKPQLIDPLIDAIVQDARFEAQLEQRRITLEGHGGVADYDAVVLRAAVENVVRNALRHTPAAGAVYVRLGCADGRVCICVEDEGPGVPPEDLGRLFEPFTRLDPARGHGDGFGLGLAISARAMQALDGTILAANRPDGGLAVTLTLPLAEAPIE